MKTQIVPHLTKLARAYRNTTLIGLQVAPVCPVELQEFTYPIFDKSNLLDAETEKAPKAATAKASQAFTTATGKTRQHAFAHEIDEEARRNDQVGAVNRAPAAAMDVILLRHERKVADLVFGAANYPAANKVTLAGTSQWSHADSDPALAVLNASSVVQGLTGRDPNVLVIGYEVFNTLKVHPKIRNYLPQDVIGTVDEPILAKVFGVSKVVVGKAIKSNPQGTTSRCWGKFASLLCVNEGMGSEGSLHLQDPTFAKTFRLAGFPVVDHWYVDDTEVDYYRAKDNYAVQVVHSESGFLFSAAIA